MSDERDLRAAEYVLGHLSDDERAEIERALARDPELRAAVARWEARLHPLSRSAPAVAPPADMLARIKTALPVRETSGEVLALRRSLRRWRAAAAGCAALAACIVIFVGARLARERQAAPTYVAAINRGGDAPALIVRVDMASGRVYIRPVAAETPAGKSLELWYIAADSAPRSMGVLGSRAETMPLPSGAVLEKAKFAVSVEPAGGSTTGGPTGPVVYAGELVRE